MPLRCAQDCERGWRIYRFKGMVARDGIEPPTPAFRGPRAMPLRCAQDCERGWRIYRFKGMVARDGIEPPTPAFSGPRSTTELPGLSADFLSCNFLRGLRLGRKEGWGNPRTVRCNNLNSIASSAWRGQTERPARGSRERMVLRGLRSGARSLFRSTCALHFPIFSIDFRPTSDLGFPPVLA
jgi:hypothetical protein